MYLDAEASKEDPRKVHTFIPPKRREGGVRNSIMDCDKNCCLSFFPSATSFYPPTPLKLEA